MEGGARGGASCTETIYNRYTHTHTHTHTHYLSVSLSPLNTGEKVYGCSLPQSSESPPGPPGSDTPLPDEVRKFAFAPQDVQVYHFEGKDDHHGIGYRGMEDRTVLSGKETRKALHGMSGEVYVDGCQLDASLTGHQ